MLYQALPILLALPVLLVLAAWCAGMETALFSLNYQDRLRLKKLSPRAAASVTALLARPRPLLISLLLVNMFATTLYLVLTALLKARIEAAWMQYALVAVNLLLMTVAAEVVSKLLAGRKRVEVCLLFATITERAFHLIAPVRVFMDDLVISPLVRVLLPQTTSKTPASPSLSPDELSQLIELGHRQGALDSDELSILRQVIAFNSLQVRDVMTPRVDIEWLDERSTTASVLELVSRAKLTRVPVCVAGGELDDGVIGMLNTKRFLALAGRTPGGGASAAALKDFLEPVSYVPERASLDKLLEHFRTSHVKMALCVDEYGSIIGVVAMADIARRLMVELSADGSGVDVDADIQAIEPGVWSVPGRLPVRDWAPMFGLASDRRFATIAGLVMDQLGRVPIINDEVRLGNVCIRVEQVTGRVVDRVRISVDRAGAKGGPA